MSVLVCHDIDQGEFVLQYPYYPPIQSIEHFKQDRERCIDIIRKSFFSDELRNREDIKNIKIDLRNVNAWVMEGVVADSYINKVQEEEMPRVFLVGDSAHAFPPSGGFGMNTGIGDSFNLAHKLAYLYQSGP